MKCKTTITVTFETDHYDRRTDRDVLQKVQHYWQGGIANVLNGRNIEFQLGPTEVEIGT